MIFGIVCARLFGYELVGEWSHPLVQSLPVLSCVCFLIGSLAAERYHVKGLLLVCLTFFDSYNRFDGFSLFDWLWCI